jgi:hypothetical protein
VVRATLRVRGKHLPSAAWIIDLRLRRSADLSESSALPNVGDFGR